MYHRRRLAATRKCQAEAHHVMSIEKRVDEFMRLFTAHQGRLHAFVLSLIPNWADADEVLQQTNLILWRKFDEFQPGTNFFSWAARIAHYKVRNFRKIKARERVTFGNDFFDAVAKETVRVSDELGERQLALTECLAKLTTQQRAILRLRYEESQSIDNVASSVGQSTEAVYKALSRIRRALFECITRSINTAEAGGAYGR
jgi:RNA polymerase sigma-70 factor, ECF subfamily